MSAGDEVTSSDLRATLALAEELAGCDRLEALDTPTRSLLRLIGADAMFSAEVRASGASRPRFAATVGDVELYPVWPVEGMARMWRQHPTVVAHASGPVSRALKATDFLARSAWQHREIFNDIYRPMGLPHELALQVGWTDAGYGCLAFHRSGPDFGERERAVLELIAPHLRSTRVRIVRRRELEQQLALLDRGLEERGACALVVGRDDRIAGASRSAWELLVAWFGCEGRPSALPADLAGWLAVARSVPRHDVLVLVRGGRRLRVRLLAGEETDLLLLFDSDGELLAPAVLAAALPISRREADVLAQIAEGRTNDAIAQALGISPHTVLRHTERLYLKLGVHTRTAAARVALDAVRHDA